MQTEPSKAERAPYPLWTYPARAVWLLVHATLWRIAWSKATFLRPAILRVFGATVPFRCLIRGSVRVYFPWLIAIGKDVAISQGVVFYNLGGVKVGNRTVISQDVYLCGGTHDYTRRKYPLICKPIVVEDDVWIGAGAFIGPGVRIGRGAVVGARAVVFKDIAPWKVAVGNPARVIKDRVLISEPPQ
jgi:putative colanic acid biosynthesis acetyltransferase WcaF